MKTILSKLAARARHSSAAPGSAPLPFEDTPATLRVLRIPQGNMAALGRFSQIEQALIDQGWRMIENMRHDGGYWRSEFVKPNERDQP